MIQVIERFHRLISHVAVEPERTCSLSELAKIIGVSLPACSNIVRTMVHLGYLQSLGERKGYILGPTAYFLTRNGPYRKHLTNVADPLMTALAEKTREMIVLVAECNGKRVELLRFEGDSLVQIREPVINERTDLFWTSTGMVILSHMDEERVKALWDRRSDSANIAGAGSFKQFLDKCCEVRRKDCFIKEIDNRHDPLNESVTLAFPIFENGKVCASLGSRIPAFRFTGKHREAVISGCRTTAERIGRNLSKTGNKITADGV
ncbi:MAG TPA: hypothetical protein DET40_18205 [Lentisphaeria bacterium]|nr:MAG: hypothetical protein A2X45_25005 [Lentisphaerae bacterium GWF2_50_93]HCE45477.1 hypothetical protein [Lentisphaeria bacterium]